MSDCLSDKIPTKVPQQSTSSSCLRAPEGRTIRRRMQLGTYLFESMIIDLHSKKHVNRIGAHLLLNFIQTLSQNDSKVVDCIYIHNLKVYRKF